MIRSCILVEPQKVASNSFCPLISFFLADAVDRLATKLMQATHRQMEDLFDAEYVSLHVRKSNVAAFHLYTECVLYRVVCSEGAGSCARYLLSADCAMIIC